MATPTIASTLVTISWITALTVELLVTVLPVKVPRFVPVTPVKLSISDLLFLSSDNAIVIVPSDDVVDNPVPPVNVKFAPPEATSLGSPESAVNLTLVISPSPPEY